MFNCTGKGNPIRNTYQWLIVAIAYLLVSPSAHAGGIYLSEIGSPNSLGTASSGNVTNRELPDASWTNPAGMTGLDEASMLLGLQVLFPTVKFEAEIAEAGGTDGDNAGEVAAIPSFFYTRPINEKWYFGFSLVAPFGGGFDYGDDFVGRYTVQEIVLQGVALSAGFPSPPVVPEGEKSHDTGAFMAVSTQG